MAKKSSKWTLARRRQFNETIKHRKRMKGVVNSSLTHTPVDMHEVVARKVTMPQDVRDIDAIFGRYQRMSELAKLFVKSQLLVGYKPLLPVGD